MGDYIGLGGAGLFAFDNQAMLESNILYDNDTPSMNEYDEYVVYKKSHTDALAGDDQEDSHIPRKVSYDHKEGADILDNAFRRGRLVDYQGIFGVPRTGDLSHDPNLLEGRVRRVICFRRAKSSDGSQDGLSLCRKDFEVLKLHPATLQYSRRTTTESRFWSKDGAQLSIVLSFSSNSKTPYDFLSMTYDVNTKTTTALIRQSYNPRRHSQENIDEYDHRMEACRLLWAHPFVTPVVLLQVHFLRTEEAVSMNNYNVSKLERRVSGVAGFEATTATEHKRYDRQIASKDDKDESYDKDHAADGELRDESPPAGAMTMTWLMQRAHEVLRECIELMDAIRWTERAVKVLILAGDELSKRTPTDDVGGRQSPPPQEDPNMQSQPPKTPNLTDDMPTPRKPHHLFVSGAQSCDPLSNHWLDIRQYLEGLLRICLSLETERRMSEARCRAQIDIIYSKMAQEDNVLNARMAVASTRDSSSMKALAVITAIFLPGEFLGTLFGMSMFDWMAEDEPETTPTPDDDNDQVMSAKFWVYWLIAIPLTLIILCVWRGWWVTEDRYFRRHLSKELSEERYWTSDGQPRQLERSFLYDFFRLSARWDEAPVSERHKTKTKMQRAKEKFGARKEGHGLAPGLSATVDFGQKDADSIRDLRSLFARRPSIIRRRPTEVV